KLGPQSLLDLVVAADVRVETDLRDFERAGQRRLPELAVRLLRVGRVVLPLERAQQLAQSRRVDARDVLVQPPRVELPAELPALALRDQVSQPVAADPEQGSPVREQALDHLRQRK